jgi:aspartate/methionine/tyrosine aminotransferase
MLPANQITIVPGLTTGLLLTYMAIIDPGDEIITMDPGYPPYEQLAKAMGAEVMSVLTLPSFQLNLPAIEASITDKTKAIVINTPNNPSGAVYPEADLRKLAKIAEKNDVLIISDEIYEHFIYEGKHFSIGSIYPNTITMHGFSKQYSMTGWRLGYISGPYEVVEAINELQQYAVFSSSSIAQHAAIEALKIKTNLVPKYKKKRDIVIKELAKCGIDVSSASGSYYVFFKAPNNLTDLEFTEKLLDHNVVLVPGRAFSSRHGYVRLSYGASIEVVKKGLSEIQKSILMLK